MRKNMGTADRIIRILLGILFVILFSFKFVTGTWGIVLVILGAVFILTSMVSFCPLYTIVGINTCKVKKQ